MQKPLVRPQSSASQSKRTGTSGFINVCQRPYEEEQEVWKAGGFRERISAWHDKLVDDNRSLPLPAIVLVYSIVGALWWSVFRYLVMDADPSNGVFQCDLNHGCLPLFSDVNLRRFVVYNVLHGVLGFGATSGLLGFRFKIPVGGPALHFLTPGTVCSPLLPSVAGIFTRCCGGVPGQRSLVAVVCYALYVGLMVQALLAPQMTSFELYPVYVLCGLCTVFDFSIFQAGRGEHYTYMMFCLAFNDWKSGLQVVQLGLWMWAGIAKIGPWFAPVIQFLTKDSLHTFLVPEHWMQRLLVKDYPYNTNPSILSAIIAWTAMGGEIVLPLCCIWPSLTANIIGACGMAVYHGFIINTLPFASVFEWNYFSIIMSFYLFFPGIGASSFSLPTSSGLIAFLCVVSLVLPLVGQLFPTLVPFLLAYRPYMGNWRFSWYVCHKKALPKHQKLKTWESPFVEENAVWFYKMLGPLGRQGAKTCEQFPYYFTATMVQVPAYRPIISVMESLLEENGWHIDDVMFAFSEGYQNQVFGWSLGTGYIAARECTREAYNHICGFEEKEMYFIQFEPASPLDPQLKVQYRCFDVTKGPLDAQYHGNIPYAELSQGEAMEFRLKPEYMQRGKSISGTFLSTYY